MKRLITCALLALSSIAFGATLTPIQLLNPAGSTVGQAIVSTGASSAPAWGGISLTGIASIAANSLIGNATNAVAGVAAITVTGCNGAAQALQWTNGSGFGCNSAIATSGANANITSITGLTTPLSVAQGGTGATSAAAARTNLGLGTAATANTGTSGSTIPLLSGANTWGAAQVFSALVTPTGGIAGITNGSAASAGAVGEVFTSTVSSVSGVSLTSAQIASVTSIPLTAGDWDVFGSIQTACNASTVLTNVIGGASTASNAFGTQFVSAPGVTPSVNTTTAYSIPDVVINVSTPTTVFLLAEAQFSTSTCKAGGTITARRRH